MSTGAANPPTSPQADPAKKDTEKSQLPDDSDDEEILMSVYPDGLTDDSVKTYVFKNQGHTLGNMLRDQLLRYPEVQFAGYSIPHPGEHVMHLRIQTQPGSGIATDDVLKKALRDIMLMCNHVEELFTKEVQNSGYEIS